MSTPDPPSEHDPLSWIADKLRVLDERVLRRTPAVRSGPQGATISIDGQTLVNFGSNDYLSLAADPRLAAAAISMIEKYGVGAGASPLITGRSEAHSMLETRLAEFNHAEAALVFTSGFAANLATIPALAGAQDTIYSDAKNHASIIDGSRLARCRVEVYRHADANHLDELLSANTSRGRRLIVTDTVFSMDGDTAPLVKIVDVARRHGAMLMVDEAHATGVLGTNGRGLAEMLGVAERIDVHVGTLSKALGAAGGFVTGSRRLIDYLFNRARAYVFSTAPPSAVCAAACAALDIVRDEPNRRATLLAEADWLRAALIEQGWNVGRATTQIVPVFVGEAARAVEIAGRLRSQGFFVPAIRPPTVPLGESLLRISLTSGHTREACVRLVASLGAIRDQLIEA